MSEAFVWFYNSSEKPGDSVTFYEELLGWTRADGPPEMTMFAGEKDPRSGRRVLDRARSRRRGDRVVAEGLTFPIESPEGRR